MRIIIDLDKINPSTLINFYNAVKTNKEHCKADLAKIKKYLIKKHAWSVKYLNKSGESK